MQQFVKPLVLSFSASRYGNPTTFGEFIRKARLEKALKQWELAKAVGVDEMTIVNWEHRRYLPARYRLVLQLCMLVGLDLKEIWSDSDLVQQCRPVTIHFRQIWPCLQLAKVPPNEGD